MGDKNKLVHVFLSTSACFHSHHLSFTFAGLHFPHLPSLSSFINAFLPPLTCITPTFACLQVRASNIMAARGEVIFKRGCLPFCRHTFYTPSSLHCELQTQCVAP